MTRSRIFVGQQAGGLDSTALCPASRWVTITLKLVYVDAYRKADIHVKGIFRATVDRHPIPSRGSCKYSRRQGVDHLLDGGAFQLYLIVVGIAQVRKAVDIMATL